MGCHYPSLACLLYSSSKAHLHQGIRCFLQIDKVVSLQDRHWHSDSCYQSLFAFLHSLPRKTPLVLLQMLLHNHSLLGPYHAGSKEHQFALLHKYDQRYPETKVNYIIQSLPLQDRYDSFFDDFYSSLKNKLFIEFKSSQINRSIILDF